MLIAFQMITENVDDVDLHVAFCIDHTAWYEVFDEEVIRHHEPFLVTCQTQIMWPRVQTEVYDPRLRFLTHCLRMFRIHDVEHHDLARLPREVERDKYARARLVDEQELWPNRRGRNRRHCVGAEVEDCRRCPALCIDEIELIIVHTRRECAVLSIARNQPDIHCSDVVTDDDGADDGTLREVPNPDTPIQVWHASADMERGNWAYLVTGDHEVMRFVNRDAVRIKRMLCVVGGGWQRLHDV